MNELFRPEAVHHATRRLEGSVMLAAPTSVITLGFFLAAVLFAAGVFAASATYARKATVIGFLVPDRGMIRVALQAPGTLQSIMVREGDVVAAGERIAVLSLSAETTSGNVGEVVAKGMRSEAAAARAKAESQLARLQVEREQSSIRLSKSEAELQHVTMQVSLQGQRLQFAQTEVERGETIAAKGFMARREVDARRVAVLTAEQELAGLRRQQAAIERDIADIKARFASIPLEIDAAHSEAQTADAALQQRRAESEARRLQFVTAPIAGRVAALPVTAGQTLSTGGTVAVVIAEGGQLEAELLAPSRSIGFVRPGQPVELSLEAFPYQRFGTVAGTIRTVSSTVLAPNEAGIQGLDIKEPVFRIRVSLSREVVQAYGQNVRMQPGMLVSALIVFDRRSLLAWLFDPIYAVGRRV
jgi:membrane fusion protein